MIILRKEIVEKLFEKANIVRQQINNKEITITPHENWVDYRETEVLKFLKNKKNLPALDIYSAKYEKPVYDYTEHELGFAPSYTHFKNIEDKEIFLMLGDQAVRDHEKLYGIRIFEVTIEMLANDDGEFLYDIQTRFNKICKYEFKESFIRKAIFYGKYVVNIRKFLNFIKNKIALDLEKNTDKNDFLYKIPVENGIVKDDEVPKSSGGKTRRNVRRNKRKSNKRKRLYKRKTSKRSKNNFF